MVLAKTVVAITVSNQHIVFLNLHIGICQLYLNIARKQTNKQETSQCNKDMCRMVDRKYSHIIYDSH